MIATVALSVLLRPKSSLPYPLVSRSVTKG